MKKRETLQMQTYAAIKSPHTMNGTEVTELLLPRTRVSNKRRVDAIGGKFNHLSK